MEIPQIASQGQQQAAEGQAGGLLAWLSLQGARRKQTPRMGRQQGWGREGRRALLGAGGARRLGGSGGPEG